MNILGPAASISTHTYTHTDGVIFNNNAYETVVPISTARTHTNGVICNNNAYETQLQTNTTSSEPAHNNYHHNYGDNETWDNERNNR